MRNMTPPQIPDNPPPVLTDDQIRALFKTCKGPSFEDRRDTAIIALFLDAGLRLGELTGITVPDIDTETMTLTVLGKGQRLRTVAINRVAMQAVDRYIRARRSHPQAQVADALWLGNRGPMTGSGIRQMLERRGPEAGISRTAPAPVAAHVRALLACGRWRGGRPDASRGLALAGDGQPIRCERRRRTCGRRTPSPVAAGSPVAVERTVRGVLGRKLRRRAVTIQAMC